MRRTGLGIWISVLLASGVLWTSACGETQGIGGAGGLDVMARDAGGEGPAAEDVGPEVEEPIDLRWLESVELLDDLSLFTFMIFSDNKGLGPATLSSMAGVEAATEDMLAEFALGLGDHVRSRGTPDQDFVATVLEDAWWRRNFYPVIADGENAYYGDGQGDWGAGGALIDELGVCERPEVTCRDNHAEFHAVLPVGDVTVHFLAAHYPDTGDDPFPATSQQYLVDELAGIERTGREIVVLAAHTGDWLRKMDESDREQLLSGADLLLGATTHFYERYDYPDDAALFLNTGSAGYALFNNYLQVNVLDHPLRIIVQDMEAEGDRMLQAGGNCWVKEIGGPITPCDFENGYVWGVFGQP